MSRVSEHLEVVSGACYVQHPGYFDHRVTYAAATIATADFECLAIELAAVLLAVPDLLVSAQFFHAFVNGRLALVEASKCTKATFLVSSCGPLINLPGGDSALQRWVRSNLRYSKGDVVTVAPVVVVGLIFERPKGEVESKSSRRGDETRECVRSV